MSLTISSTRPSGSTSITSSVAHAYNLSSQSQVSSAYTESAGQISGAQVEPSNPVIYANASRQTKTVSPFENAQEVSKAFNQLAESFGGRATSYSQDMTVESYGTIGSHIDVYA